ncbi:hypothetical protein LCGC14_0791850 [marine sediment metagenome]|uniref:Uncharacterized protein n=1 Tax=marine sediment metagenome TaxID=412755 RepID=A0A0F9PSA9_9ZZZZ|nr:hypothetical protein [archaeon]
MKQEIELTGLQRQEKRLLSLSQIELPKRLFSYDGREYTLEIGELIPKGSGYFINYFCIFHDDILVKAKTLSEAKRQMILKLNTKWIENGLVGKEYDLKTHKLKWLPGWCKN